MSIKINDSYSELHYLVCYGVAQGSVVGPAVFNIYVHSFHKLIKSQEFEI